MADADVDVSYAPERNIDITDIIIFQAIVSIREKKQRADNKTIFDYINKNSASNFTEEYIAERVETLIEDEKLSNKKTYQGMDSFYLTEISQNFIDSKQVEPEVIAVNTPLLQRTCGQVWDGDWGSTEETSETLRMLEAKFVAMKSFMMNEIYDLKEKIKHISTPITGNGKENWSREVEYLREENQNKNQIIQILLQNQTQLLMRDDINKPLQRQNFNLLQKNIESETPKDIQFTKPKHYAKRNDTINHDYSNNFLSPNRYECLRDHETETIKDRSNKQVINDEENTRLSGNHKKSKKIVVILGDSIIKEVQGYKLSKSIDDERHVIVKSYSGATTNDMKHHMIPNIEKKPDQVILHCGTNDLSSDDSADAITDNIISVAQSIKKKGIPVTISCIIPRNDRFNKKASIVNNSLRKHCLNLHIDVIEHENIEPTLHTNKRGLHLNNKGISQLFRNYLNYFKYG